MADANTLCRAGIPYPVAIELARQTVRARAGRAVHDAALARMARHDRLDIRAQVSTRAKRQCDIVSREGADELAGLAGEQARDDVGARARRSGRGDGDHRWVAERAGDAENFAVVGPEIVGPARDAMRLVHCQQLWPQTLQHGDRRGLRQPFRREIEQGDAPCADEIEDTLRFLRFARRMQRAGDDAFRTQGLDLVAHQRNERGDDDGGPAPGDGGQLIEQRFARAGRHDRKHILASQHVRDDLLLAGPKVRVPENALKRIPRLRKIRRAAHFMRSDRPAATK